MKKILVPVDFSPNAENAVRYAIDFAKVTDAALVLLHTYQVMPTTGMFPSVESYMKSDRAKQMLALAKEVEQQLGASRVGTKIITGDFIEVAVQMYHEEDYDLLIMGTEGVDGWIDSMTGTYTSELIKNSEKAILVVPDTYTFQPIKNIVLASDQKAFSLSTILEPLIQIAKAFDAKIRIYHVETGEEDAKVSITKDHILNEVAHSFHYELNSTDVIENIDSFVEEYNAQLLCMIRRHRTFLEQLFHMSKTRYEILRSKGPLLVLHENKA